MEPLWCFQIGAGVDECVGHVEVIAAGGPVQGCFRCVDAGAGVGVGTGRD
jgi:hypothetical protein